MNEKRYLEMYLPKYLEESIKRVIPVKKAFDLNDNSKLPHDWDCLIGELNADINCAEVDGDISTEQAWYLREKYLGMSKELNT